jgi:hypothetical protein
MRFASSLTERKKISSPGIGEAPQGFCGAPAGFLEEGSGEAFFPRSIKGLK